MSVEYIRDMHQPQYSVSYSREDGEWVATSPSYPSLSWLAPSPEEAIRGMDELIAEVEADLYPWAAQA